MGRVRTGNRPDGTPAATAEQPLLSGESDITLTSGNENESVDSANTLEPRRRGRRRKEPPPPIALDQEFISNPAKMNFALLLALLMRHEGSVTLRARDLDAIDDEQLSVVFSLSLDATELSVSVVSADSGIIRSPEAKWAPNPTPLPAYPYAALPRPDQIEAAAEAERQQRAAMVPNAVLGSATIDSPSPGRITEMPPRTANPPTPQTTEAPKVVFPFETGANPGTAVPLNLESLQRSLARDRQIEAQEAAAAARVEAGGQA